MANNRRPNARTPFTAAELTMLRQTLEKTSHKVLAESYVEAWQQCRLIGEPPHPPHAATIQQLVQVWREMHRRRAKGRD